MFRGYVPTKNKKCLVPFKDRKDDELLDYEQARKLEEFAGIIAEDFVLIDVDEKEQAEILFKIVENENLLCRVYETRRGMHFFFKNSQIQNQRIKATLAVGLKADVKPGKVNTYSILKYGGVERKIIYDILDGEEYQEVPKYLLPLKRGAGELVGLGDGDGRNDALFKHIQTLERNDFSKDEIKNALRVINSYVFKEPLSESELAVITREESFGSTEREEGGRGRGRGRNRGREEFQHDVFARQLIQENHIKRINGRLHIYKDGIYVDSSAEIERKMIERVSSLTRALRQEVIAYLDLLVSGENQLSDANLIAFNNGVLNIETGELLDFSPEWIITNKIKWNYNPNAKSDLVDDVLTKLSCENDSIKSLMEEMVGYCFYRRNELRKSFILTGDKANGKSTLLDMITNLLGGENVSALDLAELDSPYKTAEIFGMLANIGDDISGNFIKNPAVFKKLVSGDRVNARKIYEAPFNFSNYAKFLFSANTIPRVKDRTGAVIDRLIIIPFRAVFNKDSGDYDPYIKYKLRSPECMERLIALGVEGLKRVLANQAFTACEEVKKELQEYEYSNSPVLNFFAELDVDRDLIGTPTKDVYLTYGVWCDENGVEKMSNIEFSKVVKKQFNLTIADKRVNGKKKRVFSK